VVVVLLRTLWSPIEVAAKAVPPVHPTTVLAWWRSRKLPTAARTAGGRVLFDPVVVQEFLDRRKHDSAREPVAAR